MRRQLFVTCLAGFGAAGCDRGPAADEYFPLADGHRWVYRVSTQRAQASVEREFLTVWSLGLERMATSSGEPQDAGHRRSTSGEDYWLRADASGVYRVGSKMLLDDAPRPDAAPRYVLKTPYTVGTQWSSTTPAYLLTRKFDFPHEVRYGYPPVNMAYTIERTGETVDVPAGHYERCLKVRGSATVKVFSDPANGGLDIPLTTLEWYCPNVGLVRLEREEKLQNFFITGGSRTLELLSYR